MTAVDTRRPTVTLLLKDGRRIEGWELELRRGWASIVVPTSRLEEDAETRPVRVDTGLERRSWPAGRIAEVIQPNWARGAW